MVKFNSQSERRHKMVHRRRIYCHLLIFEQQRQFFLAPKNGVLFSRRLAACAPVDERVVFLAGLAGISRLFSTMAALRRLKGKWKPKE